MSADMTTKQEFFCREYLVDFNGTQAAIRAGYSPDSAGSQASDLLKLPKIKDRIDELTAERAKACRITADKVLIELARIAFVDIRKVVSFGKDGVTLINMEEIHDDDAAAIAEVRETVTAEGGGSIGLKLHDKTKALELLAKHLNIFKEQDGPSGMTVINLTPNFGEKKLTPRPAGQAPAPGAQSAPPSSVVVTIKGGDDVKD